MPTDSKRVAVVGRIITMMKLADDVKFERKGVVSPEGDDKRLIRFQVTIDVQPSKIATNRDDPWSRGANKLGDDGAAARAMKRSDQIVGREAYLAMGVEPPPMSKDERDQLHQELKNEGIVQTASKMKRAAKKRTVRGRDACAKCGQPLKDGVCVACVKDILERDDDGLFDVG